MQVWSGVVTGRLWRVAILTATGAVGATSQANAALYYWSDSDSGSYSRPVPTVHARRQKARHQAKKIEAPKEAAKPQGPVIIAISIEKQNLKIYDANGFFAEAPVSTGMKGHPTPMGVFSVIQKQKLHHSNIYSGAPMPYMQRITWSGIAIHAGVLPGYPASHGCIRMPMSFAVKMWNWTRMGARVVVTPGEITPPQGFSHALLVAQKVVPQPEPQADTPPARKPEKASDADTPDASAISAASLELRSTVGHGNGATRAPTSLRDQTHTADAGSDGSHSATMNDASSAAGTSSSHEETAAPTDSAAPAAESAGAAEGAKPEAAISEPAKSEAEPTEPKSAETKAAEPASPVAASIPADEARPAAPAGLDSATAATGSLDIDAKPAAKQADAKAVDLKAADPKAETPIANPAKTDEKSGDSPKAVTDTGGNAPDANKDQTRVPDAAKPAVAAAPKRSGQIAVFVSRKDQKLYVRQNFAPLFDTPVTIAASDRPLGTHIFTAQIDKNDANLVHWSVLSMPASRHIARDEDDRSSRRRKMTGAAEVKEMPRPDSPTEALDRLTIPADAMARITDAVATGTSIIVSDQGINQGETGEGTDFIVSLR
jgi:lipoprotein-anchoring transpeptidase ErfK/SrfK